MNCAEKLLEPTIFFILYTKSPSFLAGRFNKGGWSVCVCVGGGGISGEQDNINAKFWGDIAH